MLILINKSYLHSLLARVGVIWGVPGTHRFFPSSAFHRIHLLPGWVLPSFTYLLSVVLFYRFLWDIQNFECKKINKDDSDKCDSPYKVNTITLRSPQSSFNHPNKHQTIKRSILSLFLLPISFIFCFRHLFSRLWSSRN